MLGFFNKEKRKIDAAVEASIELLQSQITSSSASTNAEYNHRLADLYSRGYIFGICDCLLQSAGVNDDEKGMSLLTSIYIKLFGEENGINMFRQSLDDQGEPRFAQGLMLGGQEARIFISSKEPVTGLANYLLNGEDNLGLGAI